MFSLDDVSLRVSAPQLSQVWASTEFRSNLLASICQRALNQCLPVTSSEPSLWGHRPLQFPCCWTASLLKPETPRAQTNIRNDAPANCSWYGHENKIKPLALITFLKLSSTHWMGLKNLMCSSSSDPAISGGSHSPHLSFPPTQCSCAGLQSCRGLGKHNGWVTRHGQEVNSASTLKIMGCISAKGEPWVSTAHTRLCAVGLQPPPWARCLDLSKSQHGTVGRQRRHCQPLHAVSRWRGERLPLWKGE